MFEMKWSYIEKRKQKVQPVACRSTDGTGEQKVYTLQESYIQRDVDDL